MELWIKEKYAAVSDNTRVSFSASNSQPLSFFPSCYLNSFIKPKNMHFSFAGALLIGSLASAAVVKRQSAATTVYTFSGRASLEGIGARTNGQLVVSRMDSADIYNIDPAAKSSTKLTTLTGVTSAAAITEISPDVFAVVGGQYGGAGGAKAGSWGVFKIDVTGATPKVTTIKMIPESVMFNGLTTLNNDTLLIGEGKGKVYRLSVSTGEYSVAIDDATMAPPSSAPIPLGIDGVRYSDGFVYYTNIFKNAFYKVAVDATGKATGTPTAIWTNIQADDMAFGPDGLAYVAASGKVLRVGKDGKTTTIASVSGTACAFGRSEKDKNTLYVVSGSGTVYSVPVTIA